MESLLVERRKWFDQYFASTNAMVKRGRPDYMRVTCPVCGYPTLDDRAMNDICDLCGWEDGGLDDPDVDVMCITNNYTLAEGRRDFETPDRLRTLAMNDYSARLILSRRAVLVAIYEAILTIDYRDHWLIIKELWAMEQKLHEDEWDSYRISTPPIPPLQ